MPNVHKSRSTTPAAKRRPKRPAPKGRSDHELLSRPTKSEMDELRDAIRRRQAEEGYVADLGSRSGRRRRVTLDDLRKDYGLAPRQSTPSPTDAPQPTSEPVPVFVPALVESSNRRPDLNAIREAVEQKRGKSEVAPAASYKTTRLQAATAEWLGEVEWNLMVTFTFKREGGVSLPLATKLFGNFIPRLREIVLRKGSTRRIPMAAVVENSREQLQNVGLQVDGREGTHIHVLLRVRGDDPYKYKDAIEKAWKLTNRFCGDPTVYCPDSDEWYLPLTSDEMRKGYTGYILKHHGTDTLGLLIPYLHLD